MDGLGYRPQLAAWAVGGEVFHPGTPGPRTNLENQGACPRVWPVIYRVPARGMGGMPVFVRGPSQAVFNNQIAGGKPGYNVSMPGLGKSPYGG